MPDGEEGVVMDSFMFGVIISGIIVAVLMSITEPEIKEIYAELCPLVLAEATPSDSLVIFQEHEGCFEFVQRDSE